MKTKLLVLTISSVILSACGGGGTSSSSTTSPTSTTTSSSTSTSSTTSPTTTTPTTTTTGGDVIDLGEVPISEARQYCEQYVTELNPHKIGVNTKYKVTINGLAISKFDLVKTKASFDLDVSYPAKVVFGDDSGYIACASKNADSVKSLYRSVADHVGEATCCYSVTGFLSIYLGEPELYLPEATYTFNEHAGTTFDAFGKSTVVTVDEYYSAAKAVQYNCAGHGYGDIYSINDVKCVQKDQKGDAYVLTDGTHYFKAIPNKGVVLSVGSTYCVAGMLTTYNWSPALRVIATKTSTAEITEGEGKDITVADIKKIKASQDDTDTRFDSFIDSFKYMYKANVYVSYWNRDNTNFYIAVSDAYVGAGDYAEETAHNTKKMIDFENNNCWNIKADEFQYCPLKDYINVETPVTIRFTLWQERFLAKTSTWKVNLFEDRIG